MAFLLGVLVNHIEVDNYVCRTCGQTKSTDQFANQKDCKRGHTIDCRRCLQDKQNLWLRERRDKYVKLLGGVCVDCGTTERLEFDHVDPALKSFDINAKIKCKESLLLPELQKCVLRCKVCHSLKTNRDKRARIIPKPHGTPGRYRQGCKCALCLAAEVERTRAVKLKRKQKENNVRL